MSQHGASMGRLSALRWSKSVHAGARSSSWSASVTREHASAPAGADGIAIEGKRLAVVMARGADILVCREWAEAGKNACPTVLILRAGAEEALDAADGAIGKGLHRVAPRGISVGRRR